MFLYRLPSSSRCSGNRTKVTHKRGVGRGRALVFVRTGTGFQRDKKKDDVSPGVTDEKRRRKRMIDLVLKFRFFGWRTCPVSTYTPLPDPPRRDRLTDVDTVDGSVHSSRRSDGVLETDQQSPDLPTLPPHSCVLSPPALGAGDSLESASVRCEGTWSLETGWVSSWTQDSLVGRRHRRGFPEAGFGGQHTNVPTTPP